MLGHAILRGRFCSHSLRGGMNGKSSSQYLIARRAPEKRSKVDCINHICAQITSPYSMQCIQSYYSLTTFHQLSAFIPMWKIMILYHAVKVRLLASFPLIGRLNYLILGLGLALSSPLRERRSPERLAASASGQPGGRICF